jgi:REP element-mobilizing transposase RayT
MEIFMAYDPEKHHRRSIRLSGHDYAGGGLYFVTICAHPEAIAAASGAPFGKKPASPERALIEDRMRITAEKCPGMEWVAHVIMPDHFHSLVRMPRGHLRLGDVIGGFKSAVSREMRRGEACLAASCGEKAGQGKAGQGDAGSPVRGCGGWHSPKEKEILDWHAGEVGA